MSTTHMNTSTHQHKVPFQESVEAHIELRKDEGGNEVITCRERG